jgi:hypothetical protein
MSSIARAKRGTLRPLGRPAPRVLERWPSLNPARPSRGPRLWDFINSSFCIFLLSSVFLSGLSYFYSQSQEHKKQAETVQRLDMEVAFRIMRLHDLLGDSLPYTEVNTGRACVIGGTIVGPGGMVMNDVYYTFDEFKERSLMSLVWQLNGLLDERDRKTLAPALESAKHLAAILRNENDAFVMLKGLDDVESGDSIWKMRAEPAKKTQEEIGKLSIGRWTQFSP